MTLPVPLTLSMSSSSSVAAETVITVHWTRSHILEQEIVAGLVAGVVGAQILMTVVMLTALLYKVQMDKQLGHVDATENVLSVADDVLCISIGRHLELQSATIVISAQCPEMRLVHSLDPLQLHHLLIRVREAVVQGLGGALHQDGHTVRYQGAHTQGYQHRDKDGAHWVSDHPAEHLIQESGIIKGSLNYTQYR